MVKKEIIKEVAKNTGLTQVDAEVALNGVLEAIKTGLVTDGEVKLVGFGTFKVADRAARKGTNPATGEEIDIPAYKGVKFKAGKGLKESVNE